MKSLQIAFQFPMGMAKDESRAKWEWIRVSFQFPMGMAKANFYLEEGWADAFQFPMGMAKA